MIKTTGQNPKKSNLRFELHNYRNSINQLEYIHEILINALKKRKLESGLLCMNELADILNEI